MKPKVLYIDDEPSSRRLVQRLLSLHYTFFEAPDGLIGLDMAVDVRPDLIIVDLNLPQLTGYEVATRIKALMPDVPVVALTADMSDHVRERALASGCDGYIAKPIDPDIFEDQLAQFLRGQREKLEDDSFREAYQQTLVARLEEKVRELTTTLESNAELNAQRAMLLKQAQRRAHLLEAGAQVSQAITAILDLASLLQTSVAVVSTAFGFSAVGMWLVEENGEWLAFRVGYGDIDRTTMKNDRRTRIGTLSLVGAAAGRRQPVLAQDMDAQRLDGVEAALPVVVGDEVIGVLTAWSADMEAFDQDAVRALQAVADQLATAISNAHLYADNARLLSQAERRARLLEAAAEVGRGVTSILDLDVLLNKTVDVLCDAYGFYYASVFLVDVAGDWAVLRAGRGAAGAQLVAEGYKLKVGGLSLVGMAIAGRQALIALDVSEEPGYFKTPLLSMTRSEMALPLIVGDQAEPLVRVEPSVRVIGAVTVQSTQEAAFDDEDRTALQVIADQLAIAIDNARLLKDLESAHTELVRTKTFEAIATATGEAIHWVGNKAAPIPGSISRVRDDLVKYLLMASALMAAASAEPSVREDLRDHPFAQMLAEAQEEIAARDFDLAVLQDELERHPFKRLRRMLSVDSIFEDLEIVEQSARSILNIKEDLIGPARQKRVVPVQIPALLRETVRSMGIQEPVVRFLTVEDVKPVLADPDQLGRVFINLIKNAMEAMANVVDKKLFIWVRVADDPNFVVADVTDNGEGIPPEVIDKIWVAFYTTKGDRGGTGLGLPACVKIISQLGGKITVESVIGEGTTFSVYLPVMKS